MGALTSNRKRGNETPLSNFDHISKKIKFSTSIYQTLSEKSIVQRFFKYPDPINPIRRQVHAPCRLSRFVKMGNLISRKCDEVKEVIDIEEMEGGVGVEGRVHYPPSFEQCDTGPRGFLDYRKERVEGGMGVEEQAHYPLSFEQCDTGPRRFIGYQKERVEGGVCEKSDIFGHKWKENDGFVEILKKDNEVIDIDDDDDDNAKEGGSEDSSIEEVEARGCEKSGLLGQEKMEIDCSVEILDDGNLKEESIGKKLDSLALKPTRDSCFYVPLYKKLLSSVEKISNSLKKRQFQILYHEKCCETYRLLQPKKKGDPVKKNLITEAFLPLTEEERAEVSRALSNSNRRRVLVTHENSNIDITGEILQCLRPRQWLNDEVINVYLELLKEREKREPQKFLKCHFFNTFFYKKLISGRGVYNYQSVRRWTSQRKLGYCLFECDKIFVPIHKDIHWCLAVINKKDKKFQYLDSLRGRDTQVLKVLARYFADEVKDKSGKDIDVSSWKQEFVEDLPEQKNGYDCGVFMIKYADFYSRNIGLCFNQEQMQYFRSRTAKELLRLNAN